MAEEPPRRRYVVRTTGATVRAEPFTDAPIVTRLRRGAVFYGHSLEPTGRLHWIAREGGGYIARALVDELPEAGDVA